MYTDANLMVMSCQTIRTATICVYLICRTFVRLNRTRHLCLCGRFIPGLAFASDESVLEQPNTTYEMQNN